MNYTVEAGGDRQPGCYLTWVRDGVMLAPAGLHCDAEVLPLADFAKQTDRASTAFKHVK